MLALAQVEGRADDPPLGLEGLGDPVQGGEAIDPVVGHDLVVGRDHASDPPVRRSLDTVDIVHDQSQVGRRAVRQREVRVHVTVRQEEAEGLRQLALDALEARGVLVLQRARLIGARDGEKRISLPLVIHVIADVEGYGLPRGERDAERVVSHHRFLLRGVVVRTDFRAQVPRFVVYPQFHSSVVLMPLQHR